MMRVAVVGLGLIGGSISLAMRQRLQAEVVGIDVERVVRSESARGVADELVDIGDESRVKAALLKAELAILATPVRVIIEQIRATLAHADVVTDTGSTKRQVVSMAEGSPHRRRFVPGHPMAGGSEGGLDHARPDLFEGRFWMLCPEGCDADAFARVERVVRGLGANLVTVSPEEHDQLVAMMSHVPQLLASELQWLGRSWGVDKAPGPAYQGITRTAGGDPGVWLDIFATNSDNTAMALRQLTGELETVARALEQTPVDLGPIQQLLERARRARRG